MMSDNLNLFFKKIIIILFALLLLAAILSLQIPWSKSFSVILGVFFILFTPGFFLSFIIFPYSKTLLALPDEQKENQKSLDQFERIITSIFLSMAAMILILFVIYQLNIVLTPPNVVSAVILINFISFISAVFFLTFFSVKN